MARSLLLVAAAVLLLSAPASATVVARGATSVTAAAPDTVVFDEAAVRVAVRTDAGAGWRAVAPAPACAYAGAGARRLLWACGTDGDVQHLVVTDLHGGAPTPLDTTARFSDGLITYMTVGRRWLGGSAAGYHWYTAHYVDWHTGATRRGRDDADPTKAPDLDALDLLAPLCTPLRRHATPSDVAFGGSLDPLLVPERQGSWSAIARGQDILLQRCGRSRADVVRRAGTFALSSSWLAYGDVRAALRLRRLRDGRTFATGLRIAPLRRIVLTKRYAYVEGSAIRRVTLPQL